MCASEAVERNPSSLVFKKKLTASSVTEMISLLSSFTDGTSVAAFPAVSMVAFFILMARADGMSGLVNFEASLIAPRWFLVGPPERKGKW